MKIGKKEFEPPFTYDNQYYETYFLDAKDKHLSDDEVLLALNELSELRQLNEKLAELVDHYHNHHFLDHVKTEGCPECVVETKKYHDPAIQAAIKAFKEKT